MDNNIKERNALLGLEVVKNLKKRNFEAFFTHTKKDALNKALEIISKDKTVSWGGSVSIDEIGLKDYLIKNSYSVINRDSAKTPEERQELIFQSLRSDIFLMSANAISYDGEIVNIDGHSNRISALCYGPKEVIIIAGMNKLTKSLDEAILRARNFSAPVNAKRVSKVFEVKTPCINTGICSDCKSETSICSNILITRLSYPKNRIKVILVNEDLGY